MVCNVCMRARSLRSISRSLSRSHSPRHSNCFATIEIVSFVIPLVRACAQAYFVIRFGFLPCSVQIDYIYLRTFPVAQDNGKYPKRTRPLLGSDKGPGTLNSTHTQHKSQNGVSPRLSTETIYTIRLQSVRSKASGKHYFGYLISCCLFPFIALQIKLISTVNSRPFAALSRSPCAPGTLYRCC